MVATKRPMVKPDTNPDETAIVADLSKELGRVVVSLDAVRAIFDKTLAENPESEIALKTVWSAVLAMNEEKGKMMAMIKSLREGLSLAIEERDEAIRERGHAILNAWEAGEEFADGQFIQNAADALAEIVGRDVKEVYKALDILLVFSEVDDEAVVMLDELFGHLAHGMKGNGNG